MGVTFCGNFKFITRSKRPGYFFLFNLRHDLIYCNTDYFEEGYNKPSISHPPILQLSSPHIRKTPCHSYKYIDQQFLRLLIKKETDYNHQCPANCFCINITPKRFRVLACGIEKMADRKNALNRIKSVFSLIAIKKVQNLGIVKSLKKGLKYFLENELNNTIDIR